LTSLRIAGGGGAVRAILDVILWPMKIDARLETEVGPRRKRGLAVSNPRIRV
jgi:hypothetical protein